MPLGTPTHLAQGSLAGSGACVTNTFSPTVGATLFAWVGTRRTTSAATQPTISDSSGGVLSWQQIIDYDYENGTTNMRLRGWWAHVPSTLTNITVTGTVSTSNHAGVEVYERTGASELSFNAIGGQNANGDPSASLSPTPLADSGVDSIAWMAGTVNITATSGHTELNEFTGGTNARLHVGYQNGGSPSATISYTTTNAFAVAVAVEIKNPPSLPPAPPLTSSSMMALLVR